MATKGRKRKAGAPSTTGVVNEDDEIMILGEKIWSSHSGTNNAPRANGKSKAPNKKPRTKKVAQKAPTGSKKAPATLGTARGLAISSGIRNDNSGASSVHPSIHAMTTLPLATSESPEPSSSRNVGLQVARRPLVAGDSSKKAKHADKTKPLGRIKDWKTFLSKLECAECNEVSSFPLCVCRNNHVKCNNCIKKTGRECSKCQTAVITQKSSLVKNLMDHVNLLCKHYDVGCILPVKLIDFSTHIKESCMFRPVPCNFGNCGRDFPAGIKCTEFLHHATRTHGLYVEYQTSETQTKFTRSLNLEKPEISSADWPPMVIEFDRQRFLTRTFLNNNVFHFAICLFAVDDDRMCEKYRCELQFTSDAPDSCGNKSQKQKKGSKGRNSSKFTRATPLQIFPLRAADVDIIRSNRGHAAIPKDDLIDWMGFNKENSCSPLSWIVEYHMQNI